MADSLEYILKFFEPFFGCRLPIDENNSCLVKMTNGLKIQIELNRDEQILIGCRLGQPMGSYKQQLLLKALEWHALFPPGSGIFGLSTTSQQLIFFLIKNTQEIQQEQISDWLTPFLETAKRWKEAMEAATLPTVEDPPKSFSGLFELSR